MMRRLALCAALVVFAPPADAEYITTPGAVLQGLDKITARVTELTLPNGQTMGFGGLVVRVSACNRRPPEEPPEAAAFVEIGDANTNPATLLFRGWMFASSPAVSPFEHPIYDVRVLRCLTR
jgi:hypothetical protein